MTIQRSFEKGSINRSIRFLSLFLLVHRACDDEQAAWPRKDRQECCPSGSCMLGGGQGTEQQQHCH